MKKFLIVTDTWAPEINGLVTALVNLKKNLEDSGYEVFIVYPQMFTCIPTPFRPELRFAIFRKNKLRKIILEQKPDYIHIASESSLGLAARNVCIEEGLKFTSSYHTNFANYTKLIVGGLFDVINRYLCWFHSKAVRTMVATEDLKEVLTTYGFKNMVIWPLGVDVDFFKKNSEAKIPEGLKKPIFTYFGRVAVEKNSEEFLKCKLPGSKLIIGDGPLRPYLEKKYPEMMFVGYKTGQELIDLLSICDVYVFPSKTETFGLSIIEAMACKIPVAAYDVIGPKDIISNGIDGVMGDNLEENALKCLDLNPEDCRTKSMQFSWRKSADDFLKHVENASLRSGERYRK